MKKRIFALLMALVMVFGLNTTFLAAPSGTVDNTMGEDDRLSAPENLHWVYENGKCTWKVAWNEIEGANGGYSADIKKDGNFYASTSIYFPVTRENGVVTMDLSSFISESGSYTVSVCGFTEDEWGGTFRGKAAETDAVTYTRPDKALGTTTPVFNADGMISFAAVDGAVDYEIIVYLYDSYEQEWYWYDELVFLKNISTDGTKVIVDFTEYFDALYCIEGEQYKVAVRALSGDINTVAHGAEGEMSNAYTVAFGQEDIKNTIAGMTSPYECVSYLSKLSPETITTLVTSDAASKAKIAELEKEWKDALKITVSAKVDDKAKAYVDASKISLLGAAFNAWDENSAVDLAVSVPEKTPEIPANYKSFVALDLKLLVNGESLSNTYPIVITMPLPAGVSTENPVILHYHGDGEPEVIKPVVNADGTITFTVDSFSTFVFASETAVSGGSPVGGDTDPVGALVAIMALSAVVAVVALKKKTLVK